MHGNGYLLNIDDTQVYISGDTEDIKEMRILQNIDVAFVCMNLPYTMDINQAASGVLEFKPSIVYPYHYRGTNGLSDVNEFKNLSKNYILKAENFKFSAFLFITSSLVNLPLFLFGFVDKAANTIVNTLTINKKIVGTFKVGLIS